jgi:F-type H+-transporting ATPase subunit b
MDGAKDEAAHIIDQANELAEERSAEITNEARRQAQDLIDRARKEIEDTRKQVQDTLRTEAVVMAVEIASKILQREVSLEDNQKLIDDFLKKVV